MDKYYIGHCCENLEERLRKHLSNHKGFTSRAKDWKIAYFEKVSDKSLAYRREMEIKRKRSRKYIQTLVSGFS